MALKLEAETENLLELLISVVTRQASSASMPSMEMSFSKGSCQSSFLMPFIFAPFSIVSVHHVSADHGLAKAGLKDFYQLPAPSDAWAREEYVKLLATGV